MFKAVVLVGLLALAVGGPAVCFVAAGVLVTRVVRLARLRVEDSRAGGSRAGDRAGDRDRADRPGLAAASSLGWLATLVSVGTIEAYTFGALRYSPGLFPDKTCYFTMGARVFPDSSELLPLSTVCRGQEIVPVWFNPLMAVLAVVSVALLVAVPFAYARQRRAAATTGGTGESGGTGGTGGTDAAGAAVSAASEQAE
ncbi:hypothetical protein ABZV93_21670 [Actinopolymorpha sp. NPDC004070]|uniref:hypothetical protein n=1 Tax=Actinopolymorpha sp. NPDC004070 TaxID=3154548 RepID=UPI0033B6236B